MRTTTNIESSNLVVNTASHECMGSPPGGGSPPEGGGVAPGGGLPCLKNNNCDSYRDLESKWTQNQVAVLKQGYALQVNIERFFDQVGVNNTGFLTLTLPDHLSYWEKRGWEEAQRRLHGFLRRAVPEIFGQGARWVRIVEPTQKGRWHTHWLIECPSDIRTGVDFAAFANQDYRTASPALRKMWALLRERCKAYGLGRSELMPVRTNAEACRKYVGKYLNKTINNDFVGSIQGKKRPPHSRRLAYSQGWRRANSSFSWVNQGREWRKAVSWMAGVMGWTATTDFQTAWGKRWAYHNGPAILSAYQNHMKGGGDLAQLPAPHLPPRPAPPMPLPRGDRKEDDALLQVEPKVRSHLGNNLQGVKLHAGTLAAIAEFGGTIAWVKHKRPRVSKWPD